MDTRTNDIQSHSSVDMEDGSIERRRKKVILRIQKPIVKSPVSKSVGAVKDADLSKDRGKFTSLNIQNGVVSDPDSSVMVKLFGRAHSPVDESGRGAKVDLKSPESVHTQQGALVSRAHWLDDSQSVLCYGCNKEFTFFRRRHHCRQCGRQFCGSCSGYSVPRQQQDGGTTLRVCEHCYDMSQRDLLISRSEMKIAPTVRRKKQYTNTSTILADEGKPSQPLTQATTSFMPTNVEKVVIVGDETDSEDDEEQILPPSMYTVEARRGSVMVSQPDPHKVEESDESFESSYEDSDLEEAQPVYDGAVTRIRSNEVGNEIMVTGIHAHLFKVTLSQLQAHEHTQGYSYRFTRKWASFIISTALFLAPRIKAFAGGVKNAVDVITVAGSVSTDSTVLNGQVHKGFPAQNVKLKQGPLKVLLVQQDIIFDRHGDKQGSTSGAIMQELDYLDQNARKMLSLQPNVVLCAGKVSFHVVKLLAQFNVVTLQFINPDIFTRVAQESGAIVVPGVENIREGITYCGEINSCTLVKYDVGKDHRSMKCRRRDKAWVDNLNDSGDSDSDADTKVHPRVDLLNTSSKDEPLLRAHKELQPYQKRLQYTILGLKDTYTVILRGASLKSLKIVKHILQQVVMSAHACVCEGSLITDSLQLPKDNFMTEQLNGIPVMYMPYSSVFGFTKIVTIPPKYVEITHCNDHYTVRQEEEKTNISTIVPFPDSITEESLASWQHLIEEEVDSSLLAFTTHPPMTYFLLLPYLSNQTTRTIVGIALLRLSLSHHKIPQSTIMSLLFQDYKEDISDIRSKLGILLQPHYSLLSQSLQFDISTGVGLTPFTSCKTTERSPFLFEAWSTLFWNRISAAITVQAFINNSHLQKVLDISTNLDHFLTYSRTESSSVASHPLSWSVTLTQPTTMSYVKELFRVSQLERSDVEAVQNLPTHLAKPIVPSHYIYTNNSTVTDQGLIFPIGLGEGTDLDDHPSIQNIDPRMVGDDVLLDSFFREHMNRVFDVPDPAFYFAYARMLYSYMHCMKSVASLQLVGMGQHHVPLLGKGQTRFAFGFTVNAPDPYYMYKKRSTAIPASSAYNLAKQQTKEYLVVPSETCQIPVYSVSNPKPLTDLSFSSMSLTNVTNGMLSFPYIPDNQLKPVIPKKNTSSPDAQVLGLGSIDDYWTSPHDTSFFTTFYRKRLHDVTRESLLFSLPSVPEKDRPIAPPFVFQRNEARTTMFWATDDGEQCAQPQGLSQFQYSEDDMTLQRFVDMHYTERQRCASSKCGKGFFRHFAGFLSVDGRTTLRAKHLHASQVPSVFMEKRYLNNITSQLALQNVLKKAFVDPKQLQPSKEAVLPVDASLQSCFTESTVRVAHRASSAAEYWTRPDTKVRFYSQQYIDSNQGESEAREGYSQPGLTWSRCVLCGVETSCRWVSTSTTFTSFSHVLGILQSPHLIFREQPCEHMASSTKNSMRIFVFGSVMLCFQNESIRPLRLRSITGACPIPKHSTELTRIRGLLQAHKNIQQAMLTVATACLHGLHKFCNASEQHVMESFKMRMTVRHSTMTTYLHVLQALVYRDKEHVLTMQLYNLEYHIQHAFLCWNRFIYELYAAIILRHSNAHLACKDSNNSNSNSTSNSNNNNSNNNNSYNNNSNMNLAVSSLVTRNSNQTSSLEPLSPTRQANMASFSEDKPGEGDYLHSTQLSAVPSDADVIDKTEFRDSANVACDMTIETITAAAKSLLSSFVLLDPMDIIEAVEDSGPGIDSITVRRILTGLIGSKATMVAREALHSIYQRTLNSDDMEEVLKLCAFTYVWTQSGATLFLVGKQASFDTLLPSTMIASALGSSKHQRFLTMASAPFAVKRPGTGRVCVKKEFPGMDGIRCYCDLAEATCNAVCKSCEFLSEAMNTERHGYGSDASHIILSSKIGGQIVNKGGKPAAYTASIQDELEGDAKDSLYVRSYLEFPSSTDILGSGEIWRLQNGMYQDVIIKEIAEEASSRVGSSVVMIHHPLQFDALRGLIWNKNVNFHSSLMDADSWMVSGGKSGCSFTKSSNDALILKSVSTTELDMFLRFAQSYFQYKSASMVSSIPTLLVPVLGAYTIQMKGTEKHYVIMPNMNLNLTPLRKFDLKGSQRNRYIREDLSSNPSLVGLDTNFIEWSRGAPIGLDTASHSYLRTAIHNDTTFLSNMNIVDYSLLVSITDDALNCGIIDYFRYYSWDKRLETGVKSVGLQAGKKLPTVIPPTNYKVRFRLAMDRYFSNVPDRTAVPDQSMVTLTYNPFYALYDPYFKDRVKAVNTYFLTTLRTQNGQTEPIPMVYPVSTILKTLLARLAALLTSANSSVRVFTNRPQQLLATATCPIVKPLEQPMQPGLQVPHVLVRAYVPEMEKEDNSKANETKSPEFLTQATTTQVFANLPSSPTEKTKDQPQTPAKSIDAQTPTKPFSAQPEKPKSSGWFSSLLGRK